MSSQETTSYAGYEKFTSRCSFFHKKTKVELDEYYNKILRSFTFVVKLKTTNNPAKAPYGVSLHLRYSDKDDALESFNVICDIADNEQWERLFNMDCESVSRTKTNKRKAKMNKLYAVK